MLEIEQLESAYGDSRILFGVDLTVNAGEAVALLGRNGMGKTTTVRSIFGIVRPHAGRVRIDGRDVTARPPFEIARCGLGLVPEGRQIFPTLSVHENLVATARKAEGGGGGWDLDAVYDLFPRLRERRANLGNQLSGGEQQMLAIGRALMTNPRLVVLDEATEGLAPLVREEIWACLIGIKRAGTAILVIDKNVDALARFADRHAVMEKGRIVWTGTTGELLASPGIKEQFLNV